MDDVCPGLDDGSEECAVLLDTDAEVETPLPFTLTATALAMAIALRRWR